MVNIRFKLRHFAGIQFLQLNEERSCHRMRGFTLIEMLMVILLVGILATFTTSQYFKFTDEARTNVTLSRLSDLRTAIIGDSRMVAAGKFTNPGFMGQIGSVPTGLNDLITQGAYPAYDPFSQKGWRGPYVASTDANWNKDAWGVALVYSSVTRTIKSCGKDMVCGNADDISVSF